MLKFLISLLAFSTSLCAQLSLPFYKETTHFRLSCVESDQNASDEILDVLEGNYARIAHDFHAELERQIPIEIYPSIQEFHEKMGSPNSGDWFIAMANDKDLPHLKAGMYMVSLNNPGSFHDQKSMRITAIHELAHFFIYKIARSDLPVWMDEGVASFEADMFFPKSIDHMADIAETKGIPPLSKFSTPISTSSPSTYAAFAEFGGYSFSYTLIEFIVEKWDFETLLSLIQRFDRFEEILGMTPDTFENEWRAFVTERYLAHHTWPSQIEQTPQ